MAQSPAPEGPASRFPAVHLPSAPGLVAIGAAAGVLLLLVLVAETLPVFVVGLILAYLLDPVVTWLSARRVPRGLATLLTLVGFVAIIGAMAWLFLDTVISQATAFLRVIPSAFANLQTTITASGLSPVLRQDILDALDRVADGVLQFDYTSLLTPIVGGLFAILGSFFTLLVLPFFVFYVLSGRPGLARSLDDSLPRPWVEDVRTVIGITLDSFGKYVRAEAVVAAALGVMTFVGLMALSVLINPKFAEFALLLAIIAAFSELIPNFGPWIAAIPAVLFTLTIDPTAVITVALLYLVLMFVEGQILVPKIEGGAFSFHPALVLFIVVAGVALMGILGAILALPVTAAAWRITRYAFRRSKGEPAGMATATRGDEDAEGEPTVKADAKAVPEATATPEAEATPGIPAAATGSPAGE
jgi:predicted PurR-regulated permease PerM